jgi:hypothetical protein
LRGRGAGGRGQAPRSFQPTRGPRGEFRRDGRGTGRGGRRRQSPAQPGGVRGAADPSGHARSPARRRSPAGASAQAGSVRYGTKAALPGWTAAGSHPDRA